MIDEQTRNLLLAALLSFLLIGLWTVFVAPPTVPPAEDTPIAEGGDPAVTITPGDEVQAPAAPLASVPASPDPVLSVPRVEIDTPALFGSISLRGGRIDDLLLSGYRETVDPDSDPVRLLSPASRGGGGYYVVHGWVDHGGGVATPTPTTSWSAAPGAYLSPRRPLVLTWDNGAGVEYERVLSVDEEYLFTVTQRVRNRTGSTLRLAPYGIVARHGEPDTIGFYILHEGALGIFDGQLQELDYDDIEDLDFVASEGGAAERWDVTGNGWLGFTDKYWMTALVPAAGQRFTGVFKSRGQGLSPVYQADMRLPALEIPPGGETSAVSYVFSGAKEVATIRGYQERLGIDRFEDAVDWGWFFYLTKPIFRLLAGIQSYVGNMGFSIILLTVLVKAVLFPLAYKSYTSLARMKKLQPEMEKIKERVGDDRAKLQQEMMALYRKEKVNPAAGCLPILLQIPIFFSLYKVLFVTIEMRHAPFVGWVRDLAAPDPTSMFNLFGLIPWTPPDFLGIGFWPLMMGVTMWLQMKLNPAPTDPIQQKIFTWMPVLFTFLLGRFPAGLVIYWTANNILTLIQQYSIMRSQGVEVDLLGNIQAGFRKQGSPPAGKT